MKKLQRSSLNELAQKMPILNEKEKGDCLGGHYYFRFEDNYTVFYHGSFDNGSDIRVITDMFEFHRNGATQNTRMQASIQLGSSQEIPTTVSEIILRNLYRKGDGTPFRDIELFYDRNAGMLDLHPTGIFLRFNVGYFTGNIHYLNSAIKEEAAKVGKIITGSPLAVNNVDEWRYNPLPVFP